MIGKQNGLELLAPIVRDDLKHKEYDRVTELADEYKMLITGENCGKLLKQFNLREDDDLFKQRERLTTLITGCIASRLMAPAQKVAKVKPVVSEIKYDPANQTNEKLISSLIANYYGQKDLDYYLSKHFIPPSFHDPNAFILTTFEDFDHRFEKPLVFSLVIPAKDAVMFEFLNNVLQYLVIKKESTYEIVKAANKKKSDVQYGKGGYWIMHTDKVQVEFEQIDADSIKGKTPDEQLFSWDNGLVTEITSEEDMKFSGIYYYKFAKDRIFQVKFYDPKTTEVPAYRIGFIPDLETDGRTCVNLFHTAKPYMLKTVKTVSELDLSSSLHVFPRLFQYVQKCPGVHEENIFHSCEGGYWPDGQKCSRCHGKGYLKHDSAQDALVLPLPTRKEEMIDLDKLAYYVKLPIELLTWMDEYIDKTVVQCIRTMYNSDVFTRPTSTNTATETLVNMENANDTLAPLADQFSSIRTHIVKLTAGYNDISKGLIVRHQFPKNFRFESINELLAQLGAATTAQATQYIKIELNNSLAGLLYRDSPEVLHKIQVIQKLDPFYGKTEAEVQLIVAIGDVRRESVVLWSNMKAIFDELDADSMQANKNISYYDLEEHRQRTLLKEKVQLYMGLIDDEKPSAQPLATSFASPPTPPPAE